MQQNARFLALLAIVITTACSEGDGPAAGNAADPGVSNGRESTSIPSPGDSGRLALEGDGAAPPSPGIPGAGGEASGDEGGGPSAPGVLASPGVAGPSSAPAPQTAATANDILLRAERAYAEVRSLQADFTQRVFVPLLESTQHSRGTLYHRAPDRFLMRFSDPAGDVIVADGRYVWMYYPSTDDGQVLRAPLAAAGQQADLYREFLSDATRRYAATLNGSEQAGGRPAKALTLVPRGPSPYSRVRIWVDDQDFLVRRFEITEENGTVRNIEMTGLRPNVALADNLFQFTPPAGVQVHDF